MQFAVDTWTESSSVNSINLVKKICYNSGDIEFFLGDCFFIGAPCILVPSLMFVAHDITNADMTLHMAHWPSQH